MNEGKRYWSEFPNGYGASVIRSPYSYGGEEGRFELAVWKEGELNYDTPIRDDVVGWLEKEEALALLDRIENL